MNKARLKELYGYFGELIYPVVAIILALLVGSIIILVSGNDPIQAYSALYRGAFGDITAVAETLERAVPLIFTGLAVAFAFRCGLFNIGAEGQLYMGAFAAALVGFKVENLPPVIHIPLAILAAAVVAGIWASIPGYLKARFGVHEVINTIMMNYIAYSLTSYLVMYPFKAPGAIPKTPDVLPSAQLYRFMEYSRLNTGIIIALVSLYAIYYLLWKTNMGYEIRAVGLNIHAAEYGGIKVKRNMVIAMFVSGALAGLAGAERVMGLHLSFIHGFSPGYGFEGIAVALLGRNHPVGILLSAILFGALSKGGLYMDMAANVPIDLVIVLQAIIIFFVAAEQMTRAIVKWRPRGGKKNELA